MSNENNKIDINKHEIDIDTLKKQNVNDLLSIKNLYSKLEGMENKISHIKYIDSTLANKLKKDYEKLKKIILDENAQAELANEIETINEKLSTEIETINVNLSTEIETNNEKLTNDVETINSQLDTSMNKLNKITTNENNACPKFCLDFEMYENESLESCKAQIDVVKSFGFKEILICVKHTLTKGTWTDITPINPYDTVKAVIDYASSLGITTIGLKPHFNDNTGTSWFRMESMSFIEAWLNGAYKSVLMNLANICIEKKLPYLGVVNEMPYQTGSYQNIWKSICDEIKSKGLKTFCCLTVHEYFNNTVCNYVDIIGLNVYPHISSKGLMTSIDESIKAFTKDLRGFNYSEYINKLANRHKDKEIWVTEVGCSKNIDALSIPESWTFETEITDNKIQEIFYRGVLGAFTNNLNLNRICFWSSRGAFRFIDNELIKPLMEDKI